MITDKRVSLFLGHYGSGKTNIAVNFALHLREQGEDVTIADLDIVNPYFRTKDSAAELAQAEIKLISPEFANSNVDLPALPAEVYSLFRDRSKKCVLDIGGDDRGAYALGRYVPYILEENDFETVFVANFYRPLTRNAEEALEIMEEIKTACHLPVTGVVNNSNLGAATAKEDILSSVKEAKRLCEIAKIPLLATTVDERLFDLFSAEEKEKYKLFKLTLQKKLFC